MAQPGDFVPKPIVEYEPAGSRLKVRGSVSHFHPGGACVDFPTATGGVLGVATDLQDLEVGAIVTLDAVVIEASESAVKVKFTDYDQVAELARHRVTFDE